MHWVCRCIGLGAKIEAEGLDRTTLGLPDIQSQLLTAVAAATTRSKLVIVMNSAGGVAFDTTLAATILQAGPATQGVKDNIPP